MVIIVITDLVCEGMQVSKSPGHLSLTLWASLNLRYMICSFFEFDQFDHLVKPEKTHII